MLDNKRYCFFGALNVQITIHKFITMTVNDMTSNHALDPETGPSPMTAAKRKIDNIRSIQVIILNINEITVSQ